MEEAEVPLEHLHEHVKESAEHTGEAWISWVALSTAILAVLAAIASLLSGEYANEAMMNEIETAHQWSYYQAKSIKPALLAVQLARGGTLPRPRPGKPPQDHILTSTKFLRAALQCSKSQLPSLRSLRSRRSSHFGS